KLAFINRKVVLLAGRDNLTNETLDPFPVDRVPEQPEPGVTSVRELVRIAEVLRPRRPKEQHLYRVDLVKPFRLVILYLCHGERAIAECIRTRQAYLAWWVRLDQSRQGRSPWHR